MVIDGNGVEPPAADLELPTASRDPSDRPPAPGRLRLVQALVNTVSRHHGVDLLGTPQDARRWLAAAGLLPPGQPLAESGQRELLELRESVRAVLEAHTHGTGEPAAADRMTMALMRCRLMVAADPAGAVRLRCADQDPFARAVGAIAIAIADSAAAGTWARLKSCPASDCGWAFYDRSPTGQSQWCSMQVCGARAKMRAYRRRRAAPQPS